MEEGEGTFDEAGFECTSVQAMLHVERSSRSE
jgi:hypothetical protein